MRFAPFAERLNCAALAATFLPTHTADITIGTVMIMGAPG